MTTLHPLLARRWSTRAFDRDHVLTEGEITRLIEAVRWAPSANNSQPWRVGVAVRGTPEYAALATALAPGNATWAATASALVLVAAQHVADDGRVRRWAEYDAGQAVAHLSIQAEADDLAVHQMGGFDPDRVSAAYRLPDGTQPMVVVAVGRRDANAEMPERTRVAVDDIMLTPALDALPLSA